MLGQTSATVGCLGPLPLSLSVCFHVTLCLSVPLRIHVSLLPSSPPFLGPSSGSLVAGTVPACGSEGNWRCDEEAALGPCGSDEPPCDVTRRTPAHNRPELDWGPGASRFTCRGPGSPSLSQRDPNAGAVAAAEESPSASRAAPAREAGLGPGVGGEISTTVFPSERENHIFLKNSDYSGPSGNIRVTASV